MKMGVSLKPQSSSSIITLKNPSLDESETEQAMHLLDCINIKSSFPIAALYIALLDSSSEEDGPPTHHQLACDLARIGNKNVVVVIFIAVLFI